MFAEQQGSSNPAQTLQDPSLREKLLGFLRFQVGLFSDHAYLLPESSQRNAYQRDNAGEAQRVHGAVVEGVSTGRRNSRTPAGAPGPARTSRPQTKPLETVDRPEHGPRARRPGMLGHTGR